MLNYEWAPYPETVKFSGIEIVVHCIYWQTEMGNHRCSSYVDSNRSLWLQVMLSKTLQVSVPDPGSHRELQMLNVGKRDNKGTIQSGVKPCHGRCMCK